VQTRRSADWHVSRALAFPARRDYRGGRRWGRTTAGNRKEIGIAENRRRKWRLGPSRLPACATVAYCCLHSRSSAFFHSFFAYSDRLPFLGRTSPNGNHFSLAVIFDTPSGPFGVVRVNESGGDSSSSAINNVSTQTVKTVRHRTVLGFDFVDARTNARPVCGPDRTS